MFTGDIGGVGWGYTTEYTFNKNTGELLTLKDIVTDKEKYTEVCKESVMRQLKSDSRHPGLNEGYEEIINQLVEYSEDAACYLSENGLVLEVPKYEMASGADGEFIFVVSYDELKSCLDIDKIF